MDSRIVGPAQAVVRRLESEFDEVHAYPGDRLAWVWKNDKCGAFDMESGAPVIPVEFDDAIQMTRTHYEVRVGKLRGLFDTVTAKLVLPLREWNMRSHPDGVTVIVESQTQPGRFDTSINILSN